MARIKNNKLAGGAILIGSLVLFGKETVAWGWSKILDSISNGAASMAITAIPWQNLIASLMGVTGLALLFWPTSKVKKPSRAGQLYNLYQSADYWVSRVRYDRDLEWFERDRTGVENRVDLARDGVSLALTFLKNGIPAPNFETTSAEKICVGLEHYFSQMMPFMRDKHVAQVEAMAAATAERAIVVATTFSPEKWFHDQA
jgi:hypothetical protein